MVQPQAALFDARFGEQFLPRSGINKIKADCNERGC
jgi:hypothetical protein